MLFFVALVVDAALAGAIYALIALALGFNRLVLRPLVGRPVIALIMVTLGFGALLRGTSSIALAGVPRRLALPIPSDPIVVAGLVVSAEKVAAAAFALVAVALLTWAFHTWAFHRSRAGVALRAMADDQQAAMAMGIDLGRYFAITWGLVGVIAVLAGTLWTAVAAGGLGIVIVGLKVFPVVVIGGLDSIPGTIVAAVLIGVLESLAAGYADPALGAGFSNVASYLALIAMLAARPYGLFGRADIVRI